MLDLRKRSTMLSKQTIDHSAVSLEIELFVAGNDVEAKLAIRSGDSQCAPKGKRTSQNVDNFRLDISPNRGVIHSAHLRHFRRTAQTAPVLEKRPSIEM